MSVLNAQVLIPGMAAGDVMVLDAPVSLWGGVDIATGQIRDATHPQVGASISRQILVMSSGRGSSSSASALLEMARLGTHPAAIVLQENDPILVMGALVAGRLYGLDLPVLKCGNRTKSGLQTVDHIEIVAPHQSVTIDLIRSQT